MSLHAEDAFTSGNIFEKDHPIILACNRHLATFLPVRLAFDSVNGDYLTGTVLARNTTSGYFQRYVSGGASGTGTAACILFEDVAPASGDTLLSRGIFTGQVFQAKCIGLDSGAITNLGARSITDATGTQILIY